MFKQAFIKKNLRFHPVWLILLLTVMVYAQSLQNSFVWDDFLVIVDNDFIKSWDNFPRIFTKEYLTSTSDLSYVGKRPIGSGELTYRPVATITYFVDYFLWKLNPFGYHLGNLLLHLANAVLFYWFSRIILKDGTFSLLAALIFALHPIQTEAVLNISFREDLLAFFFMLAALLLYIRLEASAPKRRVILYALSLSAYFLAVFSKEMAVTFPLLLFLYDLYFTGEGKNFSFLVKIKTHYSGYVIVTLFYLWVRFFLMPSSPDYLVAYPGGNFYTNILTMAKAVATYFVWLFFPMEIYVFKMEPSFAADTFWRWEVLSSVGLIILCAAAAVKMRRSAQVVSFCIVWFFAALLPVLNIIPLENILAARYLYIPSAGFCLAMAVLVQKILQSRRVQARRLFLVSMRALAAGLLIFYGVLTLAKGYLWRDEIVFRREMTRRYPDREWAHRHLSGAYMRSGRIKEAEHHLLAAKKLAPDVWENYMALGDVYQQQRRYEEAMAEFKKVLGLNPSQSMAYHAMCVTWGLQQKNDQARECFHNLLALNVHQFEAYYNLGVLYETEGNWEKAREMFEQALRIDAHSNVAKKLSERLKAVDKH